MSATIPDNPCPVCGRYQNRAMTVDAVVIEEKRVLLIKRKNEPFKNYWALPGGYLDRDETAEAAAFRELVEETGLIARSSVFIGVFDEPSRHPDQVVSAAYLVTEWEGKAEAGDDAAEAGWFSLSELPGQIAFDHRLIIERAFALC